MAEGLSTDRRRAGYIRWGGRSGDPVIGISHFAPLNYVVLGIFAALRSRWQMLVDTSFNWTVLASGCFRTSCRLNWSGAFVHRLDNVLDESQSVLRGIAQVLQQFGGLLQAAAHPRMPFPKKLLRFWAFFSSFSIYSFAASLRVGLRVFWLSCSLYCVYSFHWKQASWYVFSFQFLYKVLFAFW